MFAVPTLRHTQFPHGAGDVGKVCGGVIGQCARLQLPDANELAQDDPMDATQQRDRPGVHLVPDMWTVQSLGSETHQLGRAT
jgi:hypothetical protein